MSSPDAECPPSSSPLMEFPPSAKCRKSIRSCSSSDNSSGSHMEEERSRQHDGSNASKAESDSSSEQDKEIQTLLSVENCSTTSFPERKNEKPKPEKNIDGAIISANQDTSNTRKSIVFWCSCLFMLIAILSFYKYKAVNGSTEPQSINSQSNKISESIKSIKETFCNQESDIWNDISSAINETISRTPKKPSIILLFANERSTMNCLATELANVCKTILQADDYREFNPKDFGDDAGVIITTLNEYPSEKKKVVMIRDILNINAEGIKALHNLCDRENPLIAEAIFILTMQTSSYKSSQKKLDFVEKQIYNKLLKSIDRDVLMALVTRITDGAIISVQSQPKLKYC